MRISSRNCRMSLAGLNPGVLAIVQRSSLGETLGRERMHFTLEVAVDKYLGFLGSEITQ